ncbi:MAG: hypothetical protein Q9224_006547, partial [Gallowayella concinna]
EAKSLAQDFSSRLEAFLKPVAKEERGKMTEFAKAQEDRYETVTNAYNLHNKTDKTECYNKLVDIDNLQKDEELQNENKKISSKERIWMKTFKAKYYLLFATFHHDKDLGFELGNCAIGAGWVLEKLPRRNESEGENLIEANELCREMHERICVERAKKMFPRDLALRPRMTKTWLEQTEKGSE